MRACGWGAVVGVLVAAGCTPSFARLDGVLVEARPAPQLAAPDELGRLEVTRAGENPAVSQNMAIKKGDTLLTSADGIAVIQLAAGYQVIMDPGTDITIENPSIFVRIGRVIIKKLKEVAEKLTVNTEIGAAAVEGTEFVVEVGRRQEMEVAVLEGRVTVYARGTARWDTTVYVAGEQGRMTATRSERLPPLDPRRVRSLRTRVSAIEQAVRPSVPDVVGMTAAAARRELERQGFVVSPSGVMTRRGPVGTVVEMSPSAGSRGRAGQRVTIEVEEESVEVPSLTGQSLGAAVQLLALIGLRVGDTSSVAADPNTQEGTVLGMAPSPGSLVRPGTAVSLTIARRVRPAQCQVPSLARMTEAQARASLQRAGWRVGQVFHGSGTTITEQTPKAGTQAACGSAVGFLVGSRIGE